MVSSGQRGVRIWIRHFADWLALCGCGVAQIKLAVASSRKLVDGSPVIIKLHWP